MTDERQSTLAWSLRHCGHIPAIADALNLPMVPDILNTIDENRGATFFIMALAQVFKSLVGQLRLLRSMQVEPVPTLWYSQTDKNISEFVAEKLNPLIDSCAPIAPLFFAEKAKRTNERISFPAGLYLLLLTAQAEPNRQSKTTVDTFMDEPWMYGDGWIDEIDVRHSANPTTFRTILMSTGPTEGHKSAQIWKNTDQRIWNGRCPACDKFFEIRFAHENSSEEIIGGVRYTKTLRIDGLPDEAAIKASTYYECPECHVHLPNAPISRLALSGTAQEPRGLYVPANSNPSPSHYGWNVNGCAIRDWGDYAIKSVNAQLAKSRGDLGPLERLVRLNFGSIWDPSKHFAKKSDRRIGEYNAGEEWDGEIKDEHGRPWRFATIDVQLDYYVLRIRMWGRYSESRGRLAAKCMSISDVEDLCKAHGVEPFRIFMDGRYDSARVRRICALKGWKVLMGEKDNRKGYRHDDGIYKIFAEPNYQDPLIGTPEQGKGGVVMEILFSKQQALDRLYLLRTEMLQPLREPGADKDPEPRPLWTSERDTPEWYWPQVEAHYRQKKTNSDLSEYWVWLGLKEDHAGDTEAMQVVVASMAGLTGAESLEAPKAEPEKAA